MAEDVVVAHLAVHGALADATLDPGSCAGERCGVFVGTLLAARQIPPVLEILASLDGSEASASGCFYRDLHRRVNPVDLLRFLANRVALHLAISLGVRGPVRTFGGAAAGRDAIEDALAELAAERVERAVVLGVDFGSDPIFAALQTGGLAARGAAAAALLDTERNVLGRAAHIQGWLPSNLAWPAGEECSESNPDQVAALSTLVSAPSDATRRSPASTVARGAA
jgi:3-oxoacyl-(acyl-carrier-protein) synthase